MKEKRDSLDEHKIAEVKERERKTKKEKRDSLDEHRNAEEKVIFKQKMKDKWQKNKRKRELIESKKKTP